MKPEDDPEARIRELERSMAETARASEIGSTQAPGGYTAPSGPAVPTMPPPVNYGVLVPPDIAAVIHQQSVAVDLDWDLHHWPDGVRRASRDQRRTSGFARRPDHAFPRPERLPN